jgi:hypothetical protein
VDYLFDKFVRLMEEHRGVSPQQSAVTQVSHAEAH